MVDSYIGDEGCFSGRGDGSLVGCCLIIYDFLVFCFGFLICVNREYGGVKGSVCDENIGWIGNDGGFEEDESIVRGGYDSFGVDFIRVGRLNRECC